LSYCIKIVTLSFKASLAYRFRFTVNKSSLSSTALNVIKEKYDYPAWQISKNDNDYDNETKIIGQQDIIEFVDNALASPLTINVLFNGSPGTGKTLHLQRLREKLPNAFYYDFSNTSGAGFIYSLIRKEQEEDNVKEMTLLLDEVDKIKPRSELFMLLNLLEGNEIHKSM
jgi:predicted ATPase with chaperone activity